MNQINTCSNIFLNFPMPAFFSYGKLSSKKVKVFAAAMNLICTKHHKQHLDLAQAPLLHQHRSKLPMNWALLSVKRAQSVDNFVRALKHFPSRCPKLTVESASPLADFQPRCKTLAEVRSCRLWLPQVQCFDFQFGSRFAWLDEILINPSAPPRSVIHVFGHTPRRRDRLHLLRLKLGPESGPVFACYYPNGLMHRTNYL